MSRWLPTPTPALVASALGSVVSFLLLHYAHLSIAPQALAPLLGLLVGAIVHKPAPKESRTPGQTLSQALSADVAKVLDSDPSLVRKLVSEALSRVPAPISTLGAAVSGDILP